MTLTEEQFKLRIQANLLRDIADELDAGKCRGVVVVRAGESGMQHLVYTDTDLATVYALHGVLSFAAADLMRMAQPAHATGGRAAAPPPPTPDAPPAPPRGDLQ